MKILLVGEFSGLHNSLKDGLTELGHDVILASTGDGWKKYPSDINWADTFFKGRVGYLEYLYKQYALSKKLSGFDVVQFMSDYLVFDKRFGLEGICYNNLIKRNKRAYFIGAGADPNIWQYWLEKKDPKLANLVTQTNKSDLDASLVKNLLSPEERIKTVKLVERADGFIPVMYEYAEPYRKLKNLCPTIPLPVNCSKIEYTENKVGSKLVVFHGLNRRGAKGTEYVEKAFEILKSKYPNDLELVIAGNMKYSDYIEFIKRVNVIIDQTNSYSLGINGLVSLAMGKVTMGGAEPLGKKELGYENCPVINIKPDPDYIVIRIEELLEKRSQISELGNQSRCFVEKYHSHIKIARDYLSTWNSGS